MLDHDEPKDSLGDVRRDITDDSDVRQSHSTSLGSSSDTGARSEQLNQRGLSIHVKNTFLEVCDSSGDRYPPDSPRALSDPGTCCREPWEAHFSAELESEPAHDRATPSSSPARAAPAGPPAQPPPEARAAGRALERARGQGGGAELPGSGRGRPKPGGGEAAPGGPAGAPAAGAAALPAPPAREQWEDRWAGAVLGGAAPGGPGGGDVDQRGRGSGGAAHGGLGWGGGDLDQRGRGSGGAAHGGLGWGGGDLDQRGRGSGRDRQTCTIADILQALQREGDPRRVFMVRQINTLGFESEDVIASHYSLFGRVVRVLVARSKAKPFRKGGAASTSVRFRPGGIGFVVMADADSVGRVLRAGGVQTVAGKDIRVEVFEPSAPRPMGSGAAWTLEVQR